MERERLEVGTRVYCGLYGGNEGIIYAIHGEQSPESIRELAGGCMVMGGSAQVDVVFEDGHESRGIPESIVRGVQWRILPGLATADDIRSARGFAILEQQRKRDDEAAADAKFAADVETLRANPAYAQLKQDAGEFKSGAAFAAWNLRAQLKQVFPRTKFSVRSKTYSGGDSIDVSWTDGPTTAEVQRIANAYSGGWFDGMIDSYNYTRSPWTSVFGDARYVFCSRSFSFEILRDAVREVCLEYGFDLVEVKRSSDGTAYIPSDCDNQRDFYDFVERRGQYETAVRP